MFVSGQKQDGLRGRSQHPAEVVDVNLGEPSVPFCDVKECHRVVGIVKLLKELL